MFPAPAQSTGELNLPPSLQLPDTDRMAMMLRCKRTREQDRRNRTHRRTTTPTPSLARHHLPTPTVLGRLLALFAEPQLVPERIGDVDRQPPRLGFQSGAGESVLAIGDLRMEFTDALHR